MYAFCATKMRKWLKSWPYQPSVEKNMVYTVYCILYIYPIVKYIYVMHGWHGIYPWNMSWWYRYFIFCRQMMTNHDLLEAEIIFSALLNWWWLILTVKIPWLKYTLHALIPRVSWLLRRCHSCPQKDSPHHWGVVPCAEDVHVTQEDKETSRTDIVQFSTACLGCKQKSLAEKVLQKNPLVAASQHKRSKVSYHFK